MTPLTPQQVDQRFGSGTVATTFPTNITTFIDLRIGNESLGVVGGGDNFMLQPQDFITV